MCMCCVMYETLSMCCVMYVFVCVVLCMSVYVLCYVCVHCAAKSQKKHAPQLTSTSLLPGAIRRKVAAQ